jgi:hypothetical protein
VLPSILLPLNEHGLGMVHAECHRCRSLEHAEAHGTMAEGGTVADNDNDAVKPSLGFGDGV